MVWPHLRDVILYASPSYYYDNMFIICLFLTFFLILKLVLIFNSEKCGNICHTFLNVTSICFPSLVSCLQFTFRNVAAKADNRRKPRFKG